MTAWKRTWILPLALMLFACAGQANQDASGQPWPRAWLDRDGDCQNTYNEVLLRDLAGLVQWADPMSCEVAGGRWPSWGREVMLDISNVRVVPLVPIGNAMENGAGDWSMEKKRRFMNDLDNLIILDPVSAREREDFGPDRWIPLKQYWCEYARRWETVKQRYGLRMPQEESDAVAYMKKSCDSPADGSSGESH